MCMAYVDKKWNSPCELELSTIFSTRFEIIGPPPITGPIWFVPDVGGRWHSSISEGSGGGGGGTTEEDMYITDDALSCVADNVITSRCAIHCFASEAQSTDNNKGHFV